MKNYLKIVVDKLKAAIKPSLWAFVPALLAQVQAALAAKDKAKLLELADRLDATAHEEREHADSMNALATELREAVADNKIDGIEVTEILEALQTVADEGEDIVKGADEDDAPPTV